MKLGNNTIFICAGLCALFSLQPFMIVLVAFMWFFWEDSKWPAFDSENYDKKTMNGPLKPWNKGY